MLKKDSNHKITILTCYDFPTARAMDESQVDVIFVGDSVGTNMLGYRSELEVTLEDMVHHLKAVRRGVTQKTLMVDLPYQTYRTLEEGLENATMMRHKGADIVKVEGGKEIAPIVENIAGNGIPIMGHIGFQPQIAMGAQRTVVGATSEEALSLFEDALALQNAGVCGMVLECVPELVAKEITRRISVPTIGIGSGKYTDGQVLVYADVVGWYNMPYRFVRRYDKFYARTVDSANRFVEEVSSGAYPQRNHGFRIKSEQYNRFKEKIDSQKPLDVLPDSSAKKTKTS
jgi:3-methyl-2-oxobutanoate hydroxymethyltransferase